MVERVEASQSKFSCACNFPFINSRLLLRHLGHCHMADLTLSNDGAYSLARFRVMLSDVVMLPMEPSFFVGSMEVRAINAVLTPHAGCQFSG